MVKIIYAGKNNREFTHSLEFKARRIVQQLQHNPWESSPLSMIEREIALTLGDIDQQRELETKLRDNLLQVQCYTDTELMQMEQRTPRYSPYRFPEREKLQRRLLDIESERRRLTAIHTEKMQLLNSRLLSLLEKHSILRL